MHKYLHIVTELEQQIGNSIFKAGGKLPSVRQLAERYQVNSSTILRALSDLERRHLLYSVARSGYYVVHTKADPGRQEKAGMDFATAAPDPDLFPYLDFQHCINKAIDMYKKDLFIYGTPQGLPSLLALLQKQLAGYQVFARLNQLFVVSGVQQALSILTAMPFPNGKNEIVIEQPGYHLYIEHLEAYGVPVVGIRRTAEGVDMNELEELFRTRRIKFFYTMPRLHNPLGTSYRTEEKRRLVALAKKYDVYLVEDDYLADLEQDAKSDPLYAYDGGERVIYLKSYSKIIFPGLRIGAAVIPDALVPTFSRYKRILDIDSSMLSQGALEIYCKSGMFDKHRHKIKTSYSRRARRLHTALEEELRRSGGLFTYPAGAGSGPPSVHTHLALSGKLSPGRIIAALKKKSVFLEPVDRHYLASFPKETLLKLNVTNVPESEIEQGVRLLGEAIRSQGRRK